MNFLALFSADSFCKYAVLLVLQNLWHVFKSFMLKYATKHLSCLITDSDIKCFFLQKFVEEYAGEADNLLTIDPVGVGSDEMFIGRAGYLSGCLWLQRKLGRQVI